MSGCPGMGGAIGTPGVRRERAGALPESDVLAVNMYASCQLLSGSHVWFPCLISS